MTYDSFCFADYMACHLTCFTFYILYRSCVHLL